MSPLRSRLFALVALAAAARCGGASTNGDPPEPAGDAGPDVSVADVDVPDTANAPDASHDAVHDGSHDAVDDASHDALVDEPVADDAVASDGGKSCQPGESESCYDGALGTDGVGACRSGTRVCESDGTYGACVGQVVPKAESCGSPFDDDCDGLVNEEGNDCSCVPGTEIDCYTGSNEVLGVGACKAGTQVCLASGNAYGACTGEVLPAVESCATQADDDCDGEPDCPGDVQWLLVPQPDWTSLLSIARGSGSNLAMLPYPPRTWAEVDPSGALSVIQADSSGSYSSNGPDVLGGAPGGAAELIVGTHDGASTWAPLLPSDSHGLFVMERNGWQRSFLANYYVWATSVTLHPTDTPAGWYLAGALNGSLEVVPGQVIAGTSFDDWFVMKVAASNGEGIFARRLFELAPGSASFDAEVSGLQAVAPGVLVAGAFAPSVSLDGTILKSKGSDDAFVAVIDGNGAALGAYTFGGTSLEKVRIVGRTGVAPIVVAGTTYDMTIGTVSFAPGAFLLRFTDALKPVSAKQWPGCTSLGATALDDVTANAYLVLYCKTEQDFGGGPLPAGQVLVAVDENDQHRFSRALPSGAEISYMLALDGALYLAGKFTGTVDFGAGFVAAKTPANKGLFVIRMTK